MSNLESRTNIILFGPHNALSRCNISKQETSWGSENIMKIPYSTHIYRFFLIPILYNVLGHSVFCALWFFNVCTMDSIPKRCYCQMTDIQNKRKGISAGIVVVFYERNKTNVYLSNFMIIWKSQKVKLQSPGLIFISMIK